MKVLKGSITSIAESYNDIENAKTIEGTRTAKRLYDKIVLAKAEKDREEVKPPEKEVLDSAKLARDIKDDMIR